MLGRQCCAREKLKREACVLLQWVACRIGGDALGQVVRCLLFGNVLEERLLWKLLIGKVRAGREGDDELQARG